MIFNVEDGKLIGKQHFKDKEVVTVHEVVGDDWKAVSIAFFYFFRIKS